MSAEPSISSPPSAQDDWHIQVEKNVDSVQKLIKNFLSDGKIYNSDCLELHKAAVKGDVDKAKNLFGEKDNYPSMLRLLITERNQTVLHVATGAKQTRFVEEMLTFIKPKDLELQDSKGNNAFCVAAMAGAKPIAEKMLKTNPDLLKIRGGENMTPLYLAALFGQREMASFLYKEHKGSMVEQVEDVFYATIRYNLYDLALELLKHHEDLADVAYEEDGTALHMLARNPSAFASRRKILINHEIDDSAEALELLRCLCKFLLKLKGDNVGTYMHENKSLLFEAAELGNSKFLAELISFYPNLARELDEKGRTIFHVAVLHRHASIFNLINDIGFDKQYLATLPDEDGNNLLHLAAKYSSDTPTAVSMVPGAALEMQQELKTFKEIELLVMPSYREMRNKIGLTPRELFTRDHKKLLKSGEDWMKKTAESCMLVATIIATVVFGAAFSVPGDYDDKGIPSHLRNAVFCVFAIADAVALSCSSISILMFLSILTSRYEEEDFLISLPLRLMVGLLTLFISITTMMLSFSLSFFLAYSHVKITYLTIPIIICTFVLGPALLFIILHRRLLKDMFHSSFRSRFYFQPTEN